MAELEQVQIDILIGGGNCRTLRAVSSDRVSCNIIERARLEALRLPWTRSGCGINYDFSDHASAPLGQCSLSWGWKGTSATAWATFVVVEIVKVTSFGVIVGASGRQKPVMLPANDIYTFGTYKRSQGTASSLLPS